MLDFWNMHFAETPCLWLRIQYSAGAFPSFFQFLVSIRSVARELRAASP